MAHTSLFPRELVERRRRALQAWEAWEKSHPPVSPPGEAIALLGFFLERLPPEARGPGLPGDYSGVRAMREALSVLGGGA